MCRVGCTGFVIPCVHNIITPLNALALVSAGVGRTGWHIDGSFQEKPFSYSVYHIVSVPSAGATVFAPLSDVLAALPGQQLARWERLYMVASGERAVHPFVYAHPLTGDLEWGITQYPSLCHVA